MNTALALILGLTLGSDLNYHANLYDNNGALDVNQQLIAPLSPRSYYLPVQVKAYGNGRGDLDCYLLQRNPKGDGWVIAAKDESNMDQCSITYTPVDDKPLRLWLVNHGVHPTHYRVHVEQ